METDPQCYRYYVFKFGQALIIGGAIAGIVYALSNKN